MVVCVTKGGDDEMSKRKCVRNCDFMSISSGGVHCDLYDTQLKLEKFNPEHFTFTVLKCDDCLKAEVITKEDEGKDKIQQLDTEVKFLADYFYSFVGDFEESLTSLSTIIETLKRKREEDV